jgi:hypothetical protein
MASVALLLIDEVHLLNEVQGGRGRGGRRQ